MLPAASVATADGDANRAVAAGPSTLPMLGEPASVVKRYVAERSAAVGAAGALLAADANWELAGIAATTARNLASVLCGIDVVPTRAFTRAGSRAKSPRPMTIAARNDPATVGWRPSALYST